MPTFLLFLAPFATAAVTVLVVTPIARAVALRVDAVALPKGDRWSDRPVALLGGVAIWSGTTLALLLSLMRGGSFPEVVLLAATCMFGVGLTDDFVHLKPSTKLTAQIAVACFAVLLAPGPTWLGWPGLDVLLTILWFAGVTNALNLLDNMDGLCAGIAAIASIAFCLSVGPQDAPAFAYAAALAGASAAFLVFNFKPASIFMGDSGSLFLGSSLALLATRAEHRADLGVLSAMAVPVLIMLIPIFDTIFVTLSRKLSSRAASTGGRDHTSHRLVALGFSERQAVVVLYALAAAGGATALAFARTELREAGVVLALLLITLVLLGVQLARVRVYDGADFVLLTSRAYTPLLVDVTYKRRIFEILLDACLVTVAYYAAYVIRFDQDFPTYYQEYVRSLPIVIACQLGSLFVAGVYRGVWHYFGVGDLTTFLKGVGLGILTMVMTLLYLYRFERYSRGVFIIYAMAVTLLMFASRLSFRVVADLASRHRPGRERAIIYGAGEAGFLLLRELRHNPAYDVKVIGFIDDDPAKHQRRMSGIPILGGARDLEGIVARERLDVVIVSSQKIEPSALAAVEHTCYLSGTKLLALDFRLRPIQMGKSSLT